MINTVIVVFISTLSCYKYISTEDYKEVSEGKEILLLDKKDTILCGPINIIEDTLFYTNKRDIEEGCINRKYPLFVFLDRSGISNSIFSQDCNGKLVNSRYYTKSTLLNYDSVSKNYFFSHTIIDNYESHPDNDAYIELRVYKVDRMGNIDLLINRKGNYVILAPTYNYGL